MVATSFKSSKNQPFYKPSLASPYISKLLPSNPPYNQPFNIIPTLCCRKEEEEKLLDVLAIQQGSLERLGVFFLLFLMYNSIYLCFENMRN